MFIALDIGWESPAILHLSPLTSGLDLEIVTELTQKSTLPPHVKYSLGITMFSLNPFSL